MLISPIDLCGKIGYNINKLKIKLKIKKTENKKQNPKKNQSKNRKKSKLFLYVLFVLGEKHFLLLKIINIFNKQKAKTNLFISRSAFFIKELYIKKA